MSAQHTPGPWKAVGPVGHINTEGDPYGHGSMFVAQVRGWGHLTGGGACAFDEDKAIAIQDANAHLIAAAPELLKTCKELREVSAYLMRFIARNVPKSVVRQVSDEMEKAGIHGFGVRAQEIIAKAEGR